MVCERVFPIAFSVREGPSRDRLNSASTAAKPCTGLGGAARSPNAGRAPGGQASPAAARRDEGDELELAGAAGALEDADGEDLRRQVAPPGRLRHLAAPSTDVTKPMSGTLFMAFLGFFEEDFRRFDFTLGMYEAHRMLAEGEGSRRWGTASLPLGPLRALGHRHASRPRPLPRGSRRRPTPHSPRSRRCR